MPSNGGIIGPANDPVVVNDPAKSTTTFTSPGTFTADTSGVPASAQPQMTAEVLIISGGRGGGNNIGGGGGGGFYQFTPAHPIPGSGAAVTVGAGGGPGSGIGSASSVAFASPLTAPGGDPPFGTDGTGTHGPTSFPNPNTGAAGGGAAGRGGRGRRRRRGRRGGRGWRCRCSHQHRRVIITAKRAQPEGPPLLAACADRRACALRTVPCAPSPTVVHAVISVSQVEP